MQKLLLVCAVITATACATRDDGDAEPAGLQQGLTIFTADPQAGVTGMYARGDLAVFFETASEIEGEPAPQHDQFTVDGIAVNVSARFTDMEGRNLMVSVGAHLIPEAWTSEGEPTPAMRAARPALFALALEAGKAIEATALPAGVAPEQRVLALTGVLMQPPAALVPARDPSQLFSGGWDHYQYFEVRSASCCGVAEHSATVFWNYSDSYGWEDGWQTNNHGKWATEMGLEGDCGGTGAWSGGGRGHFGSDALQYCDMKNGYAACGIWPFSNNHNCHDDTKVQRANIVYGQRFGSAPGWCSGSGCDLYAPSCY